MNLKELGKLVKDCSCIYIQLPEGLKTKAWEIVGYLESLGKKVYVDFEPTYGFCDLRDENAKQFNCDCLLHIGHNSFGFDWLVKESKIRIIVWEYKYSLDELKTAIDETLEKVDLKEKTIGLVSSLQFLDILPYIKRKLEERGYKVVIPNNPQILGCNVSNALTIEDRVECFLVPTQGSFYPLGLALQTNKPVYALDLERREIINYNNLKRKYERVKYLYYTLFLQSKRVAILVSKKKGQRFGNPIEIKKKLERMGKEAIIVVLDEISEEKLLGLKAEFYINTACPRLFDNYEKFSKPIMNWIDLEKLLKEKEK